MRERDEQAEKCQSCKNTGMMICPTEVHMYALNEYNDCHFCDGEAETPEKMMCHCQDA